MVISAAFFSWFFIHFQQETHQDCRWARQPQSAGILESHSSFLCRTRCPLSSKISCDVNSAEHVSTISLSVWDFLDTWLPSCIIQFQAPVSDAALDYVEGTPERVQQQGSWWHDSFPREGLKDRCFCNLHPLLLCTEISPVRKRKSLKYYTCIGSLKEFDTKWWVTFQ